MNRKAQDLEEPRLCAVTFYFPFFSMLFLQHVHNPVSRLVTVKYNRRKALRSQRVFFGGYD